MHFTTLPSLAPFFALLLLGPLATAGCGRTACIEWTAAEGPCPSQATALAFFEPKQCPGVIKTIDSAGDFSGGLCCYAVTQDTTAEFGPPLCAAGASTPGGAPTPGNGGVGGAPGFGTTATFAVSTGFASSGQGGSFAVGSSSGGGGLTTCATCSQVLTAGTTADQPCGNASMLLKELDGCACQMTSKCLMACASSLCAAVSLTKECGACLSDATSGCSDVFVACEKD